MLGKKIAILGASMVLAGGLVSTSTFAATHTHYHYAKTFCSGGVCHKWTRNVTHTCNAGKCKTYRTHYHYHWTWRR